jgi:hypothetical protein
MITGIAGKGPGREAVAAFGRIMGIAVRALLRHFGDFHLFITYSRSIEIVLTRSDWADVVPTVIVIGSDFGDCHHLLAPQKKILIVAP